jgi:hypothetical protein
MSRSVASRAWWIEAAAAVFRRPSIWRTALVESAGLVPRGWWRRWPPLPLPSAGWLAFRMETAYGDAGLRPSPEDVVTWLDWCRASRRPTRRRAVWR